jgi:hypothetical protein
MRNSGVLLLILVLSVSACKSRKESNAIDLNAQVLEQYWQNQYDFDYLELRGKATTTFGEKTNNVSLHLKMKKDSIIWGRLSLLGFDIAKILITKDSFFMVNYIMSTYMAYDNSYLNGYIGFEPQVGQLQNLMLGNALFLKDLYSLDPESVSLYAKEGVATNTLKLNEEYRTYGSSINTPDTTQSAEIQYDTYEIVDQGLMPKNVNIDIQNAESLIHVVLNYQVISSKPIAKFPFYIPNGFQRQ